MILFTGSGALADHYSAKYPCKVISARKMNTSALTKELKLATVVVHNAACIKTETPVDYIESNLMLTKKIIDLSYACNKDVKFVNISSMSFLSDTNNTLDTGSMNDYALSKYLGEIYCLQHASSNVCSVRFSTLFYQNHQRDGLSMLGYDAAINGHVHLFNNGGAKRDFLPIGIAVEYLYRIINDTSHKKTWTICSGRALSFKHFADIASSTLPNIQVFNEAITSPSILSNFDTADIESLGIISFDIDLLFVDYLKRLHANNDIQ